MTDILDLPNKWREFKFKAGEVPIGPLFGAEYCEALCHASNMLEAALPVWTLITDNPESLPPVTDNVMFAECRNGRWLADVWSGEITQDARGLYWRPLCDLDYPPDTGEK